MKCWIQTASGQKYYPFSPERVKPDIDSLAHQLALTNRYSGATKFPYSVAQHSVEGAWKILIDGYSNEVALAFLLHDAAEVLGFLDLVAPVKYGDDISLLGRIFAWLHQRFENKIHNVLMKQYGVDQDNSTWGIVKKYDRAIIADEYRYVIINNDNDWELPSPLGIKIKEKGWEKVKEEFLVLFYKLSGEKRG